MENVNNKTSRENQVRSAGKRQLFFYLLLTLVFLRPSLDSLSQKVFRIHYSLPYINFNIIIALLVFVLGIFFLIKNIQSVRAVPLFLPITAFLTLSLAGIFYAWDNFNSLREFIRISSIFILYFSAYLLIQNKQDFSLLVKIILASYLIPGSIALKQLISGQGLPDIFGGFNRLYGTFAHPNPFAFYSLFILALALGLVLVRKEKTNLWIKGNPYLPLVIILPIIIFYTYARSAIAGLLIFIIAFGLLRYRKVLLIGLLFLLIFFVSSNAFQERIYQLFDLDPLGSVVWRIQLWQDMLSIAFWQPWLGYGTGNFVNLTEFYRGFKFGSLEAHNDYLRIFVENGIFGLIIYLWLIISLLAALVKIVKKNIGQEKTIGLSIFVISLTLYLVSCFDNILQATALQWNLWILIASWLKVVP